MSFIALDICSAPWADCSLVAVNSSDDADTWLAKSFTFVIISFIVFFTCIRALDIIPISSLFFEYITDGDLSVRVKSYCAIPCTHWLSFIIGIVIEFATKYITAITIISDIMLSIIINLPSVDDPSNTSAFGTDRANTQFVFFIGYVK